MEPNASEEDERSKVVGLDAALVESLEELLARHGIDGQEFVNDLFDIAENCDEPSKPIEDVPLDRLFSDLGRILPAYIRLLDASLQKYGCEMYSEKCSAVPQLLLTDGEKRFPFLQHAALENGIGDEYTKHLYVMLGMVMGSIFQEQAGSTRH